MWLILTLLPAGSRYHCDCKPGPAMELHGFSTRSLALSMAFRDDWPSLDVKHPKLWQLATQIDITELPDEIFNDQKILKLASLYCTMRSELANCLPCGGCIWPRTGDIEILFHNNFLNLPWDTLMEVRIVQEGPFGTSRSRLNWTNMSWAVYFTITSTCPGRRCVFWEEAQSQVAADTRPLQLTFKIFLHHSFRW